MRRKLFAGNGPLFCLLVGMGVSCHQNGETVVHTEDHTPVMRLTKTTIEVPQSYVADVQAVQFVEIKPKVEGFVEEVLVDEGEHVQKGQVLFKLSSPPKGCSVLIRHQYSPAGREILPTF